MRNPEVRIEMLLSNEPLDLIGSEIDVALRIGALPDSTFVARKLGTLSTQVYAGSAYIARYGEPLHPDELQYHRTLAMQKNRHGNGYQSEYLHLSAIAVRAGERVAQGELVGKVGSTGLATGPHLHYGLKKNGKYVNPVVEHRNMPPGEPVPSAERAAFVLERTRLFALFDSVRPRNAN